MCEYCEQSKDLIDTGNVRVWIDNGRVVVEVRCQDCGRTSILDEYIDRCPVCGKEM